MSSRAAVMVLSLLPAAALARGGRPRTGPDLVGFGPPVAGADHLLTASAGAGTRLAGLAMAGAS